MVVDDEPIMTEGLKVYLDWESYSVGKIITCQDGKSALELAKTEKPDIIMTDIRMPEMSGLELISKVKEILPDCICIIISGYNDFEYAKKGMELGAFYYIVKPIEEEELRTVISNAVAAVNKKKQEKEIISRYQRNTSTIKKHHVNGLLSDLILKQVKLSPQEIERNLKEHGIDFHYPFYSACVTMLWIKTDFTQEQIDYIYSVIEEKVNEELTNYPIKDSCIYSFHVRNHLVIVIGCKNFEKVAKRLEFVFNNISKIINQCFNWFMTTVLGIPVSKINEISLAYTGAVRLCEYKTFFNNAGFFRVNNSEPSSAGNPFLLSSEEKREFIERVKNNDIDGIYEMLNTFRNYTNDPAYQDKYILFSVILEIMISTARILDHRKIKLEQFLNIEIFTHDFLETFKNADQLFKWLFELFTHISNAYVNKESSELERRLTEEIKEYVKENYNSKITLQEIANHFHYNCNYLGRLFKKNEGIKFSVYLNDFRIEKAMELLTSTDSSVEEIAYKVGYNDPQYFIKVFKSKTGITPLKYRNRMSGKGDTENDESIENHKEDNSKAD